MQTTNAQYKRIIAGEHTFETKVTINGNELGGDKIISLDRTRKAFANDLPSIGGALASSIVLKVRKPSFSIPKMAAVTVSVRVKNDSETSAWLAAGTYYIDTREESEAQGNAAIMTITAYDAMLKAEADYPNTEHDWPYKDSLVVAEIAAAIGVTVDSRVSGFITAGNMINLPSDYSMRETLEHIAGMYAGNFIITNDNKLMFIPLWGLDYTESGYYLADENGNALTFGNEGWFIFV